MRALLDALPQLIWTSDAQGRCVAVNRSFADYTGAPFATLQDLGWLGFIHVADRERTYAHWRSAVNRHAEFDIEFRLRARDLSYRWFHATAGRIDGDDAESVFFVGTCSDIEDHRRTEDFLRLLGDASAAMTASLDTERTLLQIAGLTVPVLADWSLLLRRRPDGTFSLVSVEHEFEDTCASLTDVFRGVVALNEGRLRQAMFEPHPVTLEHFEFEELCGSFSGIAHIDTLRRHAPRSVMIVPLATRQGIGAVLMLVHSDSGRQHQAADLRFAEALAKRAGAALENAGRFERERRVATRLQQASLPSRLPSIAGFAFDCVFRPGREDAQIGGDWYDAYRLPDGRVVISIGDVAGSGLEAAVVMGAMRHILRGVGQLAPDPVVMLDAADRALRSERPDGFVTAFVAIIDPVTSTMCYASAGHPPPLMLDPLGNVTRLEAQGLPLGIRMRSDDASVTADLPEKALIAFYTDGLTEIKRDPIEGERTLLAVLRSEAASNRQDLARSVCDRVLGGERTHDDVAILTTRVDLSELVYERWHFSTSDGLTAATIRREIDEQLAAAGINHGDRCTAELVFSELVGNVARHAPGSVDVILAMDGHAPVLHILDRGGGFRFSPKLPSNLMSENGRGLFLVASLTEDFSVSRRHDGGSHARAVLCIVKSLKHSL